MPADRETGTTPARYPSAAALIEETSRARGLTDFGRPDIHDGLDRFLAAIEAEAGLSEAAADRLIGQIRRRLTSRLEIEDHYRRHPEIAALPAGLSTWITGLPRTGTTAMTNMLSLDDEFRCLRAWEQVAPVPPPVPGAEATDPRRVAAVAGFEAMMRENPALAVMHLFDPDATEEDVEVLGMAFQAQQMVLPIFAYHAWWRTSDMRETFAFHRRVTRLLQSAGGPDRWLFKAPAHAFHLDPLFASYPDSRVIVTHRDPAKVVPSAISIMSALQPAGAQVDPHILGRKHAEHFRVGMERMMAARARIGEDRFLDIHHRAFVTNPWETIERVYAFLGRDLRPAARAKMEAWYAANRSGAHGKHRYTAEQWGLTEAGLRADYAPYIDRYGVALER